MRAFLGLGLSLLGCAAAPVDYAALENAAQSRQRWADSADPAATRDAAQLLARPLTVDTAARVALLKNRAAKAAAETLGIAQAELAGVKRLPNPELHGALRFRKNKDTDIELTATIDVSALLFTLSRASAAEAEVAAAKLEAVGTLVDLSFDARRAFVEYQAALELLELRKTVLAAFEASALAAERLHEAGNVTALHLASEQAMREEARLALTQARAEAATAREQLNGAMGIVEQGVSWRAAAHLPELPPTEPALTELENEALRANVEVAAAKQRYTAASKQAGIANVSGWLPELKAGVSAERDDTWGVGPAVVLGVPLFYQGQGEVGVARARMKREQHLYASETVQVRDRSRAVRARLEAARAGVQHEKSVVLPLRERVVEQTQLEYNGMLVGVFQLLEAKRQQLSAAEQYLDLRRRYWLASLEAERLRAGSRHGD
ncbi:MAG TPA: TolC family protein [Polyangiaceae bacterium]|nr:TolC family protein [Polyangiaceae bacterium]